MIAKGNNESDVLTIPLELTGYMVHFRHYRGDGILKARLPDSK
jgi:hypothetical protein